MPDPGPLPRELVTTVERVLKEDIGAGDLTTGALVDENALAKGEIRFRERAIVAGGPVAELVLRELDVETRYEQLVAEGEWAEPGAPVMRATARARAILTSERVLLNFVAHLSGIATLAARFVEAVNGTGVSIYDTRKTTPGLRGLEKYAVRAGGGTSHRMGLYDAVLIKDNHLALLGIGPSEAAARAKARLNRGIEVEVTTVEDALACARAGADVIMLDNFDPEAARRTVEAVRAERPGQGDRRPVIEISGGVTLENVREYALARPDRISVGALTHSAVSVNATLDVYPL